MKRKEKGITLIALIITIIVMLILVGVTVNIAIQGGLFSTAREATKRTEIARIEEQILAAKVSAMKEDGTIDGNKLVEELEQIDGLEVVDYKEGDKVVTVKYVDKVQEIDLEIGESVEIIEGEIEKVKDDVPGDITNSGKYDGSENNPYLIESIEDLVAFSEKVDSGETYEGKTIKLAYNLDFNSNNSYINPNSPYTSKEQEEEIDINENGDIESIKTELTTSKGFNDIGVFSLEIFGSGVCSEITTFKGTFDGNEKTINNLYMNALVDGSIDGSGVINCSLFATNAGTIKDLGVSVSKDSVVLSGIVGLNGDYEVWLESYHSTYPSNLGALENCYCKFNNGAKTIVGLAIISLGSIKNCYTSGGNTDSSLLELMKLDEGYTLCMYSGGCISNCYSSLDIGDRNLPSPFISQDLGVDLKIVNCFNASGEMFGYDHLGKHVTMEECYTSKNLNGKTVLEIINNEGAFKEDTNNINNGYPILSWQ